MVNVDAAMNWVRQPPSRFTRLRYWWSRLQHHSLARPFQAPINLGSLATWLFWALASGGIILAPIWLDMLSTRAISPPLYPLLVGVMLVLLAVQRGAPAIRSWLTARKSIRREQDSFATRHFNVVSELFKSLPEDCLPDEHEWKMRTADQLLSCIVHLARSRVDAFWRDEMQATLLGFENGSVIVRSRGRTDRLRNGGRPYAQAIAYYVAVSGKQFVVNDWLAQGVFPKTGLTADKPRYRSILQIPVILGESGARRCVGVVSIDAPPPCAFWGDDGDSLATQLMPFVHIFTVLLREGYQTVDVKED